MMNLMEAYNLDIANNVTKNRTNEFSIINKDLFILIN